MRKLKSMNILHLSDIHFSNKQLRENLSLEIDKMVKCINDWQSEFNKEIDYIFVSGDIAKTGCSEEYEIAKFFFTNLLGNLNINKENIFFVAGNHDVCRDNISNDEKEYKKRIINFSNDDDIISFKNDIYPCKQELFYNKFKPFDDFISQYSETLRIFQTLPNKNYQFVHVCEIPDAYIITLNTSLLSDELDNDKFFLVQEQLESIESKIGHNQNVLIIMHHPLNFLYQREREYFEGFLSKQNKNLIFCGHYHQLREEQYKVNSTWVNECRGTALYAEDSGELGFSIYEINYEQNIYNTVKFYWDPAREQWSYSDSKSNSFKYEISNIDNKSKFINDRKPGINTDEKCLLDFIFGDLSKQFDTIVDVYSYLENLFIKKDNKFLQIAQRVFEAFNDTPLLNILKNNIIKIIVLHSNNDFHIENSDLLQKDFVLTSLMNNLNIIVSSYKDFSYEQRAYWLDFIDRNIEILPKDSLTAVTNILRQNLYIKEVSAKGESNER